jgi:hypothetical protein
MRRRYRITGALVVTLATSVAGVAAVGSSAGAATSAKSEYQAALKAASSQNVHYVSSVTEDGTALEVVGDTGKTSGSEALEEKTGSTTSEMAVILIGSTGYVQGNSAALKTFLDFTATQSSTYAGKWLSFPSSNSSLAGLVSGLLDSEVGTELKMSGPYTFAGTKKIVGLKTEAIDGTAPTESGTEVPIVLFVDASGTPRPVEELTDSTAENEAIEGAVVFSKWGEKTHPKAPTNSTPLLPLLPAG